MKKPGDAVDTPREQMLTKIDSTVTSRCGNCGASVRGGTMTAATKNVDVDVESVLFRLGLRHDRHELRVRSLARARQSRVRRNAGNVPIQARIC
jgi:hypothetical protein